MATWRFACAVFILSSAERCLAQTCEVVPDKMNSFDSVGLTGSGAYGATKTTPATFEVTAGSMQVRVYRPNPQIPSATTKVEIFRKSDKRVVCSSDWVSITPYHLSLQTDKTEQWLVRIFDDASGGPPGGTPNFPRVSFRTDTLPLSPSLTPVPPLARSGRCEAINEGAQPTTAVEKIVDDKSLSLNRGQMIGRYRFEAGKTIYVALRNISLNAGDPPKFLLRAYAKLGAAPLQIACEQELSPAQGSRKIMSIAFGGGSPSPRPGWLIELDCATACQVGPLPITLEILRELNPGDARTVEPQPPASDSMSPSTNAAVTDYLCYFNPGVRRGARISAENAFAGTTQLQIKIVGLNTSSATTRTIQSYLLYAVSLWRRACTECVPDNLSIINFDDRTFLDKDLATFLYSLNPASVSATDKDSMFRPNGAFSFWALMGQRVGSRTPLATYVEVPPRETRWRSICDVPSSYLPDPLLRIQRALPCKTPLRTSNLGVELKVSSDGLSCGNSSNLIACEKLGANVELNAKDYTFTAIGSTGGIIGAGRSRVDLMQVLLHEIGHWIGLGHTLSPTVVDIMEEDYETDRCIENTSVDLLRKVVVDRPRPTGAPLSLKFGLESRAVPRR